MRCVKKNNVATLQLTQTTAIDLMDGRPLHLHSNPSVNEIFGTRHGADGPDIVWERSGYSGRGLVSGTQLSLQGADGLPEQFQHRLSAGGLP